MHQIVDKKQCAEIAAFCFILSCSM